MIEERLSSSRKMITNRQVDLYNQAATDVFSVASRRRGSGGGSSSSSSSSGVRLLTSPRLAAAEATVQSEDGLHLPGSANNVVGGTCLELRVELSFNWSRGLRDVPPLPRNRLKSFFF